MITNGSHRVPSLRGGVNAAPKLILLMAGALLVPGCAGLQPGGDATLTRDVLETKNLVATQKDIQESSARKLEYRLDTIDEKIQQQGELEKNSLSEMDRVIRAQAKEIESLKRQLDDLTDMLSAVGAKLGVSGATGTMSLAPSEGTAPATAATPDPATPGMTPGDLYVEALKQFNLGRFEQAKAQFEQVLASGVSGDQAIQTRYWLGETYFSLGDMVKANDTYKALIIENKSHALAWRSLERLAEISAKQGRNADAIRLYDQIINRNPTYEGLDRVKEAADKLRAASAPPADATGGNEPVESAPATPGN